MADLYLRFKLRIEVSDNEIQTCVHALVISYRKWNEPWLRSNSVSKTFLLRN